MTNFVTRKNRKTQKEASLSKVFVVGKNTTRKYSSSAAWPKVETFSGLSNFFSVDTKMNQKYCSHTKER